MAVGRHAGPGTPATGDQHGCHATEPALPGQVTVSANRQHEMISCVDMVINMEDGTTHPRQHDLSPGIPIRRMVYSASPAWPINIRRADRAYPIEMGRSEQRQNHRLHWSYIPSPKISAQSTSKKQDINDYNFQKNVFSDGCIDSSNVDCMYDG